MYGRRTAVNVVAFLIVSALLIFLGATHLVFSRGGGRTLSMDFSDASGLAPRNDVTMRGVPVGAVRSVVLTRSGLARVTVILQPGVTAPAGTKAEISRRSAIGDITLNLTPGDGPPLPDGARLALADTVSPPDAEKTIEELARVLHAVPS